MNSKKRKEVIFSSLGAAFIAVCSWLTIPGIVPFTLQTFAVYLVLSLFGARIGLQSIIVYILIGSFGVPVFSGFSSGIGYLFGMTGGYIIGFVFIGLIFALLSKILPDKTLFRIISLVIGTFVCYSFGTVWFMFIYARANEPIGIATALTWCVLPFILPDILKLILAVSISKRLRPLVMKK